MINESNWQDEMNIKKEEEKRIGQKLFLDQEKDAERALSYVVPDYAIEEVKKFLERMGDPALTKKEWSVLLEKMNNKQEQDLNYKLALLEENKKRKGATNEDIFSDNTIYNLRVTLSNIADLK